MLSLRYIVLSVFMVTNREYRQVLGQRQGKESLSREDVCMHGLETRAR